MARQLLCLMLIYALLVTACATPPGPSASVQTGAGAASSGDPCAGWERCVTEACSVDLGVCYLAKHLARAIRALPPDQHVVATAPVYDATVAEQIEALSRKGGPNVADEVRKLIPQLIPRWLPSIQAALITRLHSEFIDTPIALRDAQLDEILREQELWRHPDFQNFLTERLKQLRGATLVVLGKASPPERNKFSRVNARCVVVETGLICAVPGAAPEAKIAIAKICVWCWLLGVGGVLAAGAIAAIALSSRGSSSRGGAGGAGGNP